MPGWHASPAAGRELAFTRHLLLANRNGVVVDARLTHATRTAEPEAALAMLEALPDAGQKTVGADKNYDTAAFVASSRAANVTSHVAQNITAHRGSTSTVDDAPRGLSAQLAIRPDGFNRLSVAGI